MDNGIDPGRSIKKVDSRTEILVVCILLLAAVAVLSAAARAGVTDTFVYSHVGLSETTLLDGRITDSPYSNIGNTVQRHANGQSLRLVPTAMVGELSLLTGVEPSLFPFVPLCGIALFFAIYIFTRKFLGSPFLAAVLAFAIVVEPVVQALTYSVYMQGWGFILMFLCMHLFMRAVESGKGTRERYKDVDVIAFLFVVLFYTYYSCVMYLLAFCGIYLLILVWTGKRETRRLEPWFVPITAIFIALVIFFLVFDPTVGFILSNLGARVTGAYNLLTNYASGLFGGFSGAQNQTSGISSGGFIPSSYVLYISTILYLFLLLPILVFIIRSRSIKKMINALSNKSNVIFVALIAIIILDLAIYILDGVISYKMVLMLAPIAAVYSMMRLVDPNAISKQSRAWLNPRVALVAFICIMTVLVCAKSAVFTANAPDKMADQVGASTSWLMQKTQGGRSNTISNLMEAEFIFISQCSRNNKGAATFIFSDSTMPILYNNNTSARVILREINVDYVIVTHGDIESGVQGNNWMAGAPIGDSISNIDRYYAFNLVYFDGNLRIYSIGH